MIPLLFLLAAADFSGTWVYKVDGHNFLVLTLDAKGGTVVKPRHFNMDGDGDPSDVSAEIARVPVKWARHQQLRAGDDRFVLTMPDPEHLGLAPSELPWMSILLQRARPSDDLTVPSPWPQPHYPPDVLELQQKLKIMVEKDQAVRTTTRISAEAMMSIDGRNRPELEKIFADYGWPKRSLVGKEATHNFWLLVQHQPVDVQAGMLPSLERAVEKGEASKSDYAYLYDRVRMNEGRTQRWGTQVKCINGLPVLAPVDDPAGLDARRQELHLPPMPEYLKGLKQMCRAMP